MLSKLRFLFIIAVLYTSILQVKGQAVDNTFKSPLTTSDLIRAMALQDDGKIVIGGNIGAYSSSNYSSRELARLNSDGSFDVNFNPGQGVGFNDEIYAIAIQKDKKIVVGGTFTTYNSQSANKIIRLNENGTIDTSFHIGKGMEGFNNYVKTITVLEGVDN